MRKNKKKLIVFSLIFLATTAVIITTVFFLTREDTDIREKAAYNDLIKKQNAEFSTDYPSLDIVAQNIQLYVDFDDTQNVSELRNAQMISSSDINIYQNTTKSPTDSSNTVLYLEGSTKNKSSVTFELDNTQRLTLVRASFYDDMNASKGTLFNALNGSDIQGVGVNTDISNDNYTIRINKDMYDSGFPRSSGWHIFEHIITPHGTATKIDGVFLYKNSYTYKIGTNTFFYVGGKPTSADTPIKYELFYNPKLQSFKKASLISTWNKKSAGYYDKIIVVNAPLSQRDIIMQTLETYLWKIEKVNVKKPQNLDANYYLANIRKATIEYFYANENPNKNSSSSFSEIKKHIKDFNSEIGSLNNQEFLKLCYDWRTPLISEQLIMTGILTKKYDNQNIVNKYQIRKLVECNYNYIINSDFRTIAEESTDIDSKAESIAWTASSLAWGSNYAHEIFKGIKISGEDFEMKAKCFARATVIPTNLGKSSINCDGLPSIPFLPTVDSDYLIVNHGLKPNPMYQGSTIHSLARGALAYKVNGMSIPREFMPSKSVIYGNTHQYKFWERYVQPNDPLIDLNLYLPKYNLERNSQGLQWLAPLIGRVYPDLPINNTTMSKRSKYIMRIYSLSSLGLVAEPPNHINSQYKYIDPNGIDYNSYVSSTKSYWKFVMDSSIANNYMLGLFEE